MVGTTIRPTEPAVDAGTTATITAATAAFVDRWLAKHAFRVVSAGPWLHTDEVYELLADILAEYTDHVIAERDALAEDLAWEMHATHCTTHSTTHSATGCTTSTVGGA